MKEDSMVSADTGVEACLYVNSTADVSWDDEADLVVIGFGGAGAAAAVEGLEQGASVLIVDRFDGGGATALSGGIFYAGGGTKQQHEAGYPENVDNMFNYLEQEKPPVSPETLRRFCQDSVENLNWIQKFGVKFDGTSLYPDKIVYPPSGKFLYFSGNEKIPRFAAHAKPTPRGHRVVGPAMTGNVYYAAMRKAALDKGAKLITHSPARRLIMDKSGNVIGVEIEQLPQSAVDKHRSLYKKVNPYIPLNGKRAERAVEECLQLERSSACQRLRLRAKRGVVLATGGFTFNRTQLERYRPDPAKNYKALLRVGAMSCNGSGIGLGQSAGGVTNLMDSAFVGKTLAPPESFLHGIVVNKHGKRFINEDAYVGAVGNAIAQQDDNTAYLVVDRKAFWKGVKQLITIDRKLFILYALPTLINVTFGGTRSGKDAAHLAKKCNIDGPALAKTIATYNKNIKNSAPDEVGKLANNCAPILSGKLYAIDVSTHNRFGATQAFTLGGLRVNEETGLVLQHDNTPISGLYAAGRCAIGMCSNSYISGLSLADTLFAGRRAAKHAMTSSSIAIAAPA